MLANTLTITVNAIPYVLVRVNQDNFGSTYRLIGSLEEFTLKFRNSVEPNDGVAPIERHNMYFERIVYATATSTEKKYTMSATVRMRKGSDPVWLGYLIPGFNTLLAAQGNSLVAGES